MPERCRALDGASADGRLRIHELPLRTILQVTAFYGRAADAAAALERALGLPPPLETGATGERDGVVILCVGPGRWWLVADQPSAPDLDPSRGAIVDQSDGRVVLEVSGRQVRDLLAKGTSIDLHPSVMPAGRCAQTALGHIAVLLYARADDRFDVHVARSYARALFEWLEDAALEFEADPLG